MPKASKETASESVTVQGYEGHLEKLETEIVEFSPTDELRRTIDVVTKNMEAAA